MELYAFHWQHFMADAHYLALLRSGGYLQNVRYLFSVCRKGVIASGVKRIGKRSI